MKLGFCSASNHGLPYPDCDNQPLAPPRSSIAMTVTMATFHHSRRAAASAILHRSHQEFDIAFRPGNRARGHAKHGPALCFNPAFGLGANAVVNERVPDDAALPHFVAARFELRLDQRDELRAWLSELQRRLENLGEADEAGITDDNIDRFGNDRRVEVAGVGLLMNDNAPVLPQLPRQLVGPDIDRIDL